jgi:hypothetical protein
MASEKSPLLSDQDHITGKHEVVYHRFSPAKKRLIVAMVSLCGLIPSEYVNLTVYKLSPNNEFLYSVCDLLTYTCYPNNCKGTKSDRQYCEASLQLLFN